MFEESPTSPFLVHQRAMTTEATLGGQEVQLFAFLIKYLFQLIEM